MTNPNGNLFDRSKAPSVKFPIVGTRHTMKVTDWPSLKDSKNFETNEIDRWPNGDPKKIILVPVTIDNEAHALWVTPGTALFAAIEKAQQDAKAEINPGGTLVVEHTHSTPSTKGAHFAPAKQFVAHYTPPSVFAKPDAFAAAAAAIPPTATPAASYTPPASAQPAPSAAAPTVPAQTLTAEQYAALQAAGVDMSAFALAGS